ncbi:dihydrolipoamide dehydrogenase [Methylobacterium sp. PvP062]|jgi:dihydrolipoamide dehydrogenase|uniref:Dihydrolipoyl dehydrogenase n=2 Tax=Methylobacterium radiotolerans TaxID=31998 RepID=B1LZN8_METRJ|nr:MULTISPECIES: dihydrolipoyl dehydrogenase [Methylobacterium]MCX7332336.1 dihydrolipoyl dehydrogenase [Hyphomicrobiales bacterium]GAN49145.1 dihydrolipoamide dehydrogenase [Methylobacterium sp. ME121]ACB22936.1 dihydrolipoamide dehydrogenase [Methylobacterium radiotolerans JCM 2831]KIU36720.1 dihydrolipoamide dehydrogenase [Methylobacterium radiotolerans]KTS00695.1 dihydrolipoamide dehydrogenase [Methylobacterium radiotolerans]
MSYDLVVIGTGPGGYVCAIRAAQLGLRTAVVEKRATHGGTCLNVGCIPSKALLHASEAFEEANTHFADLGIDVGTPKLDLKKMMAFKAEGVAGNTKGVEFLLKKNKVDTFHGTGRIAGAGRVEVIAEDGGNRMLETKSIVIATGSDVARLPGVTIDEKVVVSSTGALELDRVPKKLLVIGAGVIGLELGSVWRRLGSEVTVVEYLDRVLPGMDGEVGKQFQRILTKQGIAFKLSTKVTGVEVGKKGGATVTVEPAAGGAAETLQADVVLVCIGRTPYTEGLGLDTVGVQRDDKGRVLTDSHYATNVTGIYAIGDVIAGPMLAHKAEDEGVAIAEMLAGQSGHVNYGVIPNVVYTFPEVASVGKTEEELKKDGIAYNAGKFPFTANGRAKANGTTDGFVKVLADAQTDRVLGVHIVGADAGNLIAEVAVAMEFGASSEDIARTCHAHPTLTEAVKEAALAVNKRAIHV